MMNMGILEEIEREIWVILVAMMPIFEVRGAIPLGISLGLNPIHSAIISMLGNIMIVPFLLKLLHPVMEYFEKTYLFSKTIGWVKRRSMKKASTIKKYSLLGLFLFVAIPVPTTGAWTGCVIATILKLNFKSSLVAISSGIVTAGLIVLGVSNRLFYFFG